MDTVKYRCTECGGGGMGGGYGPFIDVSQPCGKAGCGGRSERYTCTCAGKPDLCRECIKTAAYRADAGGQVEMFSTPDTRPTLPADTATRKATPLARGVLDYFPAALAAVARLSQAGNDKHNPGQMLHWARGKSTDHADCIMRHLIDRGTVDPEDGISHSVKVAWRALALLQEELEAQGAPRPRGARDA